MLNWNRFLSLIDPRNARLGAYPSYIIAPKMFPPFRLCFLLMVLYLVHVVASILPSILQFRILLVHRPHRWRFILHRLLSLPVKEKAPVFIRWGIRDVMPWLSCLKKLPKRNESRNNLLNRIFCFRSINGHRLRNDKITLLWTDGQSMTKIQLF